MKEKYCTQWRKLVGAIIKFHYQKIVKMCTSIILIFKISTLQSTFSTFQIVVLL